MKLSDLAQAGADGARNQDLGPAKLFVAVVTQLLEDTEAITDAVNEVEETIDACEVSLRDWLNDCGKLGVNDRAEEAVKEHIQGLKALLPVDEDPLPVILYDVYVITAVINLIENNGVTRMGGSSSFPFLVENLELMAIGTQDCEVDDDAVAEIAANV
jgi:hypothetical protein